MGCGSSKDNSDQPTKIIQNATPTKEAPAV